MYLEVVAADDGEVPAGRAVRANDTKFTTLISDFLLQHVFHVQVKADGKGNAQNDGSRQKSGHEF